MKTLRINVNSYWFTLLDDNALNSDYREVKPYWTKRLTTCDSCECDIDVLNDNMKHFDEVEFFVPYTTKKIKFELLWIKACKGIDVGLKMDAVFIIKLGKRI